LVALLADGLDGIVARKFGAGNIGESLEAMADMISLSIAPLFFILLSTIDININNEILFLSSIAVGIFFLICSAIRLASFHVLKDKQYFLGLPASVSTMILICIGFLDLPIYAYLLTILLLSITMVSSIKFPKPTISLNTLATILIILTIALYTSFDNIAFILLLSAMILYSIVGPIYLVKNSST
jgi:CDP-diacylglycerol--serine O-phosphatidyltransferase